MSDISNQNIIKFVPYSSVVGGNSYSAIAGEREVLSNVINEMLQQSLIQFY